MRSAPTVSPTTAPTVPTTPPPGADGVEFNIWRSGRILGLEDIDNQRHKHSYPALRHDAQEVIWIRAGVGKLNCQSASFEIQEGEAMVIPPNEMHGGGGSGSVLKYVAIALPKALIDRIFPDFKFLVDGEGRPVP